MTTIHTTLVTACCGLVLLGAVVAHAKQSTTQMTTTQNVEDAHPAIVYREAMRRVGDGGDPTDPPGIPPADPPQPPDCIPKARGSLYASASEVALGQSVSLSWEVTLPPKCTLGEITVAGQGVGLSGSIEVYPWVPQAYSLVFSGKTLALALVTKVRLPNVTRIKGSTPDWRALLIYALSKEHHTDPDRKIILAYDVDMDLTGFNNIFISNGITLTSEARPLGNAPASPTAQTQAIGLAVSTIPGLTPELPVARDARHPGPRLFTNTRGTEPLFFLKCDDVEFFSDNVKMNGFRIHGPQFNIEGSDDHLERAIMSDSCRGLEIANMELAGFSGQAIYVIDPAGRISHPEEVQIHDNFFHHNQHVGGNGYGVEAKLGAQMQIDRNVFDFNRHAIAADGQSGTSYIATHNLVLKGGGYHQTYPVYGDYYTHQFDVHGTEHCGPLDLFSDSLYNCGQAGERFEYIENAFQYRAGNAIKVRGRPLSGIFIAGNVFPHDGLENDWGDDAIYLQTEDNITIGPGNVIDVQTYGQYGVCDFDGDGQDDLFLATGASWWFASGGKQHWVFMNAQDAHLNTLGLGDFDGDGRCDVFAVHGNDFMISSGGSGAWRSLGTFSVPFDQLRFGHFNSDGIMDIFRRAPDGQWSAISPGIYDWTLLQSSSFPLSALRFGDFDHDGITDVIAVQGGLWSISSGGRDPWKPLNPTLSHSLESVLIGDINGDGFDDILRYVPSLDGLTARWEISWSGTTNWVYLGR
jgi:hypothetical protein